MAPSAQRRKGFTPGEIAFKAKIAHGLEYPPGWSGGKAGEQTKRIAGVLREPVTAEPDALAPFDPKRRGTVKRRQKPGRFGY